MRKPDNTEAGDHISTLIRCVVRGDGTALSPAWPHDVWKSFATACGFHGMTAYLYSTVGRDAFHNCPGDIREALALEARGVATRNMEIASALAKLQIAFRQREIPWLLLKGPAVALTVYGDIGRRSFTDLDILVPPRYAAVASRALEDLAYRNAGTPEGLAFGPVAIARDFECAFVSRDDRRIIIDLHWSLSPRLMKFRAGFGTLWKRRSAIALAGNRIPVPGKVDLAWYLAIHGSRHLWYRWIWVCDLAIAVSQLDPAELLEFERTAIERGNTTCTAAGLAVLAHLRLLSTDCMHIARRLEERSNSRGIGVVRTIAVDSLLHRHAAPSNNTDLPLAHAFMVDSQTASAKYLIGAGLSAASRPGLILGNLKRKLFSSLT